MAGPPASKANRKQKPAAKANRAAGGDTPVAVAESELTRDERTAAGKEARKQVPRSSHAAWEPAAGRPDPVELLEGGEAALIVIGESRIEEQLDKVLTRAEKTLEKEIDADNKEFKRELEQAEKEAAAS